MGSADAGEGPERGPDEGPDEARYADLPPIRVTVPDDARELDPDVRAYHRELKRRAAGPPGPPSPAERPALPDNRPGRVVIGVLALLLIVASLAMMVSPRRQRPPPQAPLATTAAGASARGLGEGLLMPDLRVRVGGVERALLDLRPAVIALVPPSCRCDSELGAVLGETGQYQLALYVAQSPAPGTAGPDGRVAAADPEGDGAANLRRLAQRIGRGKIHVLEDPSGRLAGGFAAQTPTLTLILVAANGVVADVRHGTNGLTASLDLKLASLEHPDAAHTRQAGPLR